LYYFSSDFLIPNSNTNVSPLTPGDLKIKKNRAPGLKTLGYSKKVKTKLSLQQVVEGHRVRC
jgi:hypothetical protein